MLTGGSRTARAGERLDTTSLAPVAVLRSVAVAVTACLVAACSAPQQKASFKLVDQATAFADSGYVDSSRNSGIANLNLAATSATTREPASNGIFKVGKPYQVAGTWYTPRHDPEYDATGMASWYGADFHGKKTANGERYDMNALTAAHPTLPMPSYVSVTNVANGRTIVVRVNDRGPYKRGRIIDLSRKAASLLGYHGHGVAKVRVRYLKPAPLDGDDSYERQFLAEQPWYRGSTADAASGQPVLALNENNGTSFVAQSDAALTTASTDATIGEWSATTEATDAAAAPASGEVRIVAAEQRRATQR